MKTVLWSGPDRKDVVEGYKTFQAKFFPECTWGFDIIDSNPQLGWTKRFLEYLQKQTEEILFYNGDDYYPIAVEERIGVIAKPNWAKMLECYEYMKCHKEVGVIQLTIAPPPLGSSYEGLLPFKVYDNRNKLGRTHLGPILARTDILINWCKSVLSKIKPKMDIGWGGCYNFELYAWEEAEKTIVLASDEINYFYRLNAVMQGGWMKSTVEFCQKYNIPIDFSKRGIYVPGVNPGVDLWNDNR